LSSVSVKQLELAGS